MLAFTNHLRELKGSYLQKMEERFGEKKASNPLEVDTLLQPPPPPTIASTKDMPTAVEGKSAMQLMQEYGESSSDKSSEEQSEPLRGPKT